MKTITIKIILLLVPFLFIGELSFTQVLIAPEDGTAHESAALEIRSDNGGLLIPNVELTLVGFEVVATNIANPADGLLIFHDGTLSEGGSSGLPRGLWYFDATAGSGKWLIYSRVGSIYSSSLDNFGEMYEANAMGGGTSMMLTNAYSLPWASAVAGFLGPGFQFLNDATVLTEIGSSAIADQLYITTDKAYYTVDVSTTLITSTSGNIVTGQLFVNDQAEPGVFFRHAFQTSGEYVNCATSGIVVLDQYDLIDFRFKTTTAAEGIFVEHLNLKLTKIGDF
jgi:hypothetical protein